jgi:hypothetical protein
VISLTLRFPTSYYLTLLLNSLRISCSFPLRSLLRGPPPPTSDRPTIEEDGDRKDGHGNVATSFGLGSPGNPILIDRDDEGYTKSKPGSAQYHVLIEDPDDMLPHDNTVPESDSRPSARPVQALLSGSSTCTSSRAVVVVLAKGVQPPSPR